MAAEKLSDEDLQEDYEEIREWLELQADDVQANCVIVTPETMGAEFALHVDKRVPEKFYPRMPRSAMPSENSTSPRVTVACTIMGCYIGYFRGERDIQEGSIPNANHHDPYLGGYVISRMDFNHAVKPNDQLVGDAHSTEELWLVPYNTENVSYAPVPVGKLFVDELTFLPVSGHKPQVKLTMYVEHEESRGLWLNKTTKLEVGCYRVSVHWPSIWRRDMHDEKHVQVEKITKEEFDERKKRSAAFLDHQIEVAHGKPAFMSW